MRRLFVKRCIDLRAQIFKCSPGAVGLSFAQVNIPSSLASFPVADNKHYTVVRKTE
jgi:hypothetical protein